MVTHSLFEMLNKIRESGASLLIIDLSSSAVSMKESEQRALKEQLSILLAVLIHSEVLRYRTVDTENITTAKTFLLNDINFRRCLATYSEGTL